MPLWYNEKSGLYGACSRSLPSFLSILSIKRGDRWCVVTIFSLSGCLSRNAQRSFLKNSTWTESSTVVINVHRRMKNRSSQRELKRYFSAQREQIRMDGNVCSIHHTFRIWQSHPYGWIKTQRRGHYRTSENDKDVEYTVCYYLWDFGTEIKRKHVFANVAKCSKINAIYCWWLQC